MKTIGFLAIVVLLFQDGIRESRIVATFVTPVEGLGVDKISSLSRSGVGRLAYHKQKAMPSCLSSYYERGQSTTRLWTQNNSDIANDKEGNTNAKDAENDTKISEDGTVNNASTPKPDNMLSNFLYGANYVHSRYLSILWKYSIVRSSTVTVPIAIGLWMNYGGLYEPLVGALRFVLAISSLVARFLQLPLEFAQSLVLSIWNISPQTISTAIGYLPNAAAIPFVQLLLAVRPTVMSVVEYCCENTLISFLSSVVAIVIWRPSVEEWQYRSILDKLLFGVPRWVLDRGQKISPTVSSAIQQVGTIIPGAKRSNIDGIANNNETVVEENAVINEKVTNLTSTNSTDEDTEVSSLLPKESTRILLGSLLFATTRLGWLSIDPTDTVGLSNSPYGFTIGFLRSIGSIFSSGAEIRRGLRSFVLLLAIHQTVSTFLIAQNIFASIYREKGLAASVGAHMSWTVGKGTIPFRLAWKFWQSTPLASAWNESYGTTNKPDSAVVGESGNEKA